MGRLYHILSILCYRSERQAAGLNQLKPRVLDREIFPFLWSVSSERERERERKRERERERESQRERDRERQRQRQRQRARDREREKRVEGISRWRVL